MAMRMGVNPWDWFGMASGLDETPDWLAPGTASPTNGEQPVVGDGLVPSRWPDSGQFRHEPNT